jgi:hypothetical protein
MQEVDPSEIKVYGKKQLNFQNHTFSVLERKINSDSQPGPTFAARVRVTTFQIYNLSFIYPHAVIYSWFTLDSDDDKAATGFMGLIYH